MKSTPWAVFVSLILAAFCALSPVAASAQGRDDIYAVAGIQVDETAANSAAAQQQGFATAQRVGLERLFQRLTTPSDQARLTLPQPQGIALERMVRSVDVENERRSGTRYLGRLTVRYDPAQVQAMLQQAGFTVMEARTAPVLIVPQAVEGLEPEVAETWRAAWVEGGYGQELAPLVVAPAALSGAPDWQAAQPYARTEAAASALYATLRVQGANATAALVEAGPNGLRDRGTVTAQIGQGDTGLRRALQALADQASGRLQNEWKAMGAQQTAARGGRVSASALYTDQRQWERIKGALEGSARTLISEIRIEAVGREGALVSFTFVGDLNQLGAELNRRGVSLEQSPNGPILRVAQ